MIHSYTHTLIHSIHSIHSYTHALIHSHSYTHTLIHSIRSIHSYTRDPKVYSIQAMLHCSSSTGGHRDYSSNHCCKGVRCILIRSTIHTIHTPISASTYPPIISYQGQMPTHSYSFPEPHLLYTPILPYTPLYTPILPL